MREPKRARRRRDIARMKSKAVRIRPEYPRAIYRCDYLAVCSCWMCGNPRKLGELTRQEMRLRSSGDDE